MIIDLLCCAVSFPATALKDPLPKISTRPPRNPGGWFHFRKNRAVETVRENTEWFTKCLAFTNLMALLALIASWGFK